jgi:hypothetical protein
VCDLGLGGVSKHVGWQPPRLVASLACYHIYSLTPCACALLCFLPISTLPVCTTNFHQAGLQRTLLVLQACMGVQDSARLGMPCTCLSVCAGMLSRCCVHAASSAQVWQVRASYDAKPYRKTMMQCW